MGSGISAEWLSDLIGMIYDCVIAPEKWNETIDAIRLALGFSSGALGVYALPAGDMALRYTAGIEAAMAARMTDYDTATAAELWGGPVKASQLPLGEPIIQSQATDRGTWACNRYYSEWLKPQGIADILAVVVARDAASVGTLALGRHESASEIGTHEVEGLRLLAPHIRRAVAISRLFDLKAVEVSTFSSVIEALETGVVLVGGDLVIVHANAAAKAMLGAEDPILSRRGKLALRHQVTNGALEAALLQAVQDEAKLGQKGIAIPARREDGAALVLHVLPLRKGDIRSGLMQSAAAAIFVAHATAPPTLPTDALRLLYDLTPAETRVFELICKSRKQAEVASSLGIAPGTVKTHLDRIFDKTGCRRQAALVKLAASFTSPLW
jgi:DNA-binding CsgD family transcriptional regulator